MCDSCTRETARLAAGLDLLEFEVSIIEAESNAGLSFPGATRILTDLEMASGVRFGAIDDLHARTAGLIARLTGELERNALTVLLADLRGLPDATAAAVLARLADLASPLSTARLPLDVDQVRDQIVEALALARVAAAGHVIDEARTQGVAEGLLADQRALRVTPEERAGLIAQAQTLVGQPVARVLATASTAGRAAARPDARPGDVLTAIDTAVTGLKPNALEDQARQATTAAVNTGRRTALKAAPAPQQVQASELLDSSTCGPCSEVDGRVYESLDAALEDYPSGGSFGGCLGGERCRGTLVAVWDTEALPTLLEPGDRPPGRNPIVETPQEPRQVVALPQAVGGTPGVPAVPATTPPVPLPQPGDPVGTPVSEALTVLGGTKTQQARLQAAIDAIDSAHGDGVLPQIALRNVTLSGGRLGGYEYLGGTARKIEISTNGDWPILTTIHEIGHFIDHQALGAGAQFGSEIGKMSGVLDAIDQSQALARLRAFDISRFDASFAADLAGHIAYLQEDAELFARAYAQWVAGRSANRALNLQLEQAIDYGLRSGLMRQWEPDDFEPIAEAIDDLMRTLGWMI